MLKSDPLIGVVGVCASGKSTLIKALTAQGYRCRHIAQEHPRINADPVLPFADASFDAVVLLEALEFLPDREATIREMARVLVPGGVALVSNRIGIDRWLLLGRVDSSRELTRRLERAGLENVLRCRWQTYYDLYWSRKTGFAGIRRDRPDAWRDVLRCPTCAASGAWAWSSTGAVCRSCGRRIEQRSGYWDLTAG